MQEITNKMIKEAVSVIIVKYSSRRYDYYSDMYDFNTINDYKMETILSDNKDYED